MKQWWKIIWDIDNMREDFKEHIEDTEDYIKRFKK